MKIVQVRYDSAHPNLAQTLGPFPDASTAEAYKEELMATLVANGWERFTDTPTLFARHGDGLATSLAWPGSDQRIEICVREFDQAVDVDYAAFLIRGVTISLRKT